MTNLTHNSFMCIYFNSLHVSSILVLIIRRINCINTTSGIYHSVSVTVSCASRKGTFWPAHETYKRTVRQVGHLPRIFLDVAYTHRRVGSTVSIIVRSSCLKWLHICKLQVRQITDEKEITLLSSWLSPCYVRDDGQVFTRVAVAS
jgi:hypothetical protein